MSKIQTKIVGFAPIEDSHFTYSLILQEFDGQRRVRIILDLLVIVDAARISKNIDNKFLFNQHLLKDVIEAGGATLEGVEIYDFKEGEFFSHLEITNASSDIEAEIGDAILFAIYFQTPIFVSEKVLNEAGYIHDSTTLGEEKSVELFRGNELLQEITRKIINRPATIRDQKSLLTDDTNPPEVIQLWGKRIQIATLEMWSVLVITIALFTISVFLDNRLSKPEPKPFVEIPYSQAYSYYEPILIKALEKNGWEIETKQNEIDARSLYISATHANRFLILTLQNGKCSISIFTTRHERISRFGNDIVYDSIDKESDLTQNEKVFLDKLKQACKEVR